MQNKRRTIALLLLTVLFAVSVLAGCTKTPETPPEPVTTDDPDTQTDPNTNTDPNPNTDPSTGNDPGEPSGPVRVTNVREFLDALKPGAEIILAPGTYDLTDDLKAIWNGASIRTNGAEINAYSRVGRADSGYTLYLSGLKDVTIRGESGNRADTQILTQFAEATVLNFRGCENVTLENLTIGHSVTPEGCDADVLSFLKCKYFTFVNLDLFGCGVFGINANSGGIESFAFRDCLFRDCTGGAFWLQELDSTVSFVRCTFQGPLGYNFFMNFPDACLRFTDCVFTDCDFDYWTKNSFFIHNRSVFDGVPFSTENIVQPYDRFDARDLKPATITVEELNDTIWEAFMSVEEHLSYRSLPYIDYYDGETVYLKFRFDRDGTGVFDCKWEESPISFTWSLASSEKIALQFQTDSTWLGDSLTVKMMKTNETEERILDCWYGDETFWLSRHHSVSVSSIAELLDAIRPGAEIMLKAGTYELSKELGKVLAKDSSWNDSHSYAQIKKVFDGYELVIRDCDGLTIRGGSDDRADTQVLTDSTYATLIKFENCNDIVLSKFTSGHKTKGDCMGDVIFLEGCNTALLDDVDYFGCGVVGLRANESRDVTVRDSDIHDCEVGPFIFYDCAGTFDFNNCMFTGSRSGGFLEGDLEPNIKFHHCVFGERETESWTSTKSLFDDCQFHVIDEYTEYEDFTFHRKSAVQIPYDAEELNDTFWDALFMTDTQIEVSTRLPFWADDGSAQNISVEFRSDGTGQLYWLENPDPTPFKWGPGSDETIAISDMPEAMAIAALYTDPECEMPELRFLYFWVNDAYVWCICTSR